MIIRDGQKWACRSCITGHRSSKCIHEDRELFPVAKKGRPSSQCRACNHGRASQSTLPSDVPCTCQTKRRGGKLGSKSPTETPPATATTAAPPIPVSSSLVSIPEYKRQRYSEDSSVYSDGSPAFPAPGWPSSSRYGSFDSMQSTSTGSSADSSPASTFASIPSNSTYSYSSSAPQHMPYTQHSTPYPTPSADYQHNTQAEAQSEYMRFQSLQAPLPNHDHWYGSAPPLPPLSPSAAGDSPSTALYKAMGLQGLPAAFSQVLANPSPLLLENSQGQDGYRQEDFHSRGPWLGPDLTSHMRSPDSYHNPYSQAYQDQIPPSQTSSLYNGMSSGNDITPHNRFVPSGAKAMAPESPGWNATTPSAVVKDSWMQLPMPDLSRPGYPDGPVRWNTAPPTLYSGAYSQGDNNRQGTAYQNLNYQQDFPEPPPLTRAAASMPMPATNDSSRFFEQTTLPQVMNLRLPERKKRKSVDS